MARRSIESESVRRILGVLLVVALLGAAVFFSGAAIRKVQADRQAGDPDLVPVSPADDAELTADALATTAPTDPADTDADAGMSEDGSRSTEPGILVVVSPTPGGAFDVTETVRLPSPTDTITLGPGPVARAGSQFGGAEPIATNVQVIANGDAVEVPEGTVTGEVALPVDGVTAFVVSYRLDGTLVRNVPSGERRGLAAIAPLARPPEADLPVEVIVTGETVLSVNCPLLSLSEQSCGRGSPPRLEVDESLPLEDALVTIQLDLPES